RRAYEPYIEIQKQAVDKVGRTDSSTMNIIDSSPYLAHHLADGRINVLPSPPHRLPPNVRQGTMAGFYGSILPAVWSFQLALRSRGLGSAWTTLHLEYEREVGELLDIPLTVTQVVMLPVSS